MNGPEVFIPLLAILLGGLTVLIPIVGFTARFALKPVVEALLRVKAANASTEQTALLEQRLSLVEEQLHSLERGQERLIEALDFQRQLEAPRS